MESADSATKPQRAEGITACRWARTTTPLRLLSYANARDVLARAHALLSATARDRAAEAAPHAVERPAS